MDIKEAINYVESKRYVMEYCDNNKLADEVIEFLKLGEKYRKMWREVIVLDENDEIITDIELNEIKQKYFPKSVKNNINLEDLEKRLKKVEKKVDDNWGIIHRDPNIIITKGGSQ